MGLALAVPLYKEFVYHSLRTRQFDSIAARKRGDPMLNEPNPYWYLWPNRVDYRGPFVSAAGYDFSYEISRESTCWDRGIACASNPELSYLSRIRLRVPDSGIAGGFVWR